MMVCLCRRGRAAEVQDVYRSGPGSLAHCPGQTLLTVHPPKWNQGLVVGVAVGVAVGGSSM